MKLLSLAAASLAAGSASAFAPVARPMGVGTSTSASTTVKMSASDELYIDMDRRNLMNLILAGSGALTVGALGIPYILFFIPPGSGGGSGGVSAKDALGNDILASAYLKEKPAGDRSLAQGLKGDATYLIVKEDKSFESYGLNAVCTHLGCVVPWSAPNNKFMCPCHGSQYAPDGHVVRGPAPLPLALAHLNVEDDKILFTPWTEEDFRTGGKAWWN